MFPQGFFYSKRPFWEPCPLASLHLPIPHSKGPTRYLNNYIPTKSGGRHPNHPNHLSFKTKSPFITPPKNHIHPPGRVGRHRRVVDDDALPRDRQLAVEAVDEAIVDLSVTGSQHQVGWGPDSRQSRSLSEWAPRKLWKRPLMGKKGHLKTQRSGWAPFLVGCGRSILDQARYRTDYCWAQKSTKSQILRKISVFDCKLPKK